MNAIAKAIVVVGCLAFIGAGLTLQWPDVWLQVVGIFAFVWVVH